MPWITQEDRAAKKQQEETASRKWEEEKDAKKWEEDTARDPDLAERVRLVSPVGMAAAAKEQGQGFFEIQLLVGSSQRDSTIFGGNNTSRTDMTTQNHAGTLAAIESVGWHLEHVGHVFVVTNESSRNKFLVSGQQTAVSGETIGIYLFRNSD